MPPRGQHDDPKPGNREWSQVVRERIAQSEARTTLEAPESPFEEEPAEVKAYVQAHREAGSRTIPVPENPKNAEINKAIRKAAGRGEVEGGEQ